MKKTADKQRLTAAIIEEALSAGGNVSSNQRHWIAVARRSGRQSEPGGIMAGGSRDNKE